MVPLGPLHVESEEALQRYYQLHVQSKPPPDLFKSIDTGWDEPIEEYDYLDPTHYTSLVTGLETVRGGLPIDKGLVVALHV